jgi:DNA-directed RNA polymerase sigma subunit (sigma70/sigma32)
MVDMSKSEAVDNGAIGDQIVAAEIARVTGIVLEKVRRRQAMIAYRQAGWTLAQVGEKFGLTRQRVFQITGAVKRGRRVIP